MLFFGLVYALMWGVYIDYNRSSSAVEQICVMLEAYLFRAYASNLKCIEVFLVTFVMALASYEAYMLT